MLDFDTKKRDDLSVIAESAGLGNITKSSLEKSLTQFRKEIKSFKKKMAFNTDPSTPASFIIIKLRIPRWVSLILVPVAGVEPARYRYHWILSPARLPIPSHRRIECAYCITKLWKFQYFFEIFFIFFLKTIDFYTHFVIL